MAGLKWAGRWARMWVGDQVGYKCGQTDTHYIRIFSGPSMLRVQPAYVLHWLRKPRWAGAGVDRETGEALIQPETSI